MGPMMRSWKRYPSRVLGDPRLPSLIYLGHRRKALGAIGFEFRFGEIRKKGDLHPVARVAMLSWKLLGETVAKLSREIPIAGFE